MVTDKIIQILSDKAKDGAWIYVQAHPTETDYIQYELGGVLPIKDNWIIYFPIYPDDQHDIHDSVIGMFDQIDQYSVSYLDQIGRKIIVSSFEEFEKEQIKLVKEWQRDLKKDGQFKWFLENSVKDRKDFPQNYLGGQFNAKD